MVLITLIWIASIISATAGSPLYAIWFVLFSIAIMVWYYIESKGV